MRCGQQLRKALKDLWSRPHGHFVLVRGETRQDGHPNSVVWVSASFETNCETMRDVTMDVRCTLY